MRRISRYESDPSTVVLGMSQILIKESSHMTSLRSKGALERDRREEKEGEKKEEKKMYRTQYSPLRDHDITSHL